MLNQSHTVAGASVPTPAWGILRLEAVKALTGIRSHATIYAHVKAGLFPDSIPLGARPDTARALKLAQSAMLAVQYVGAEVQ